MTNTALTLKKLLPLKVVKKINDTNIKVGVLNFNHGNINQYDFTVQYVMKVPYSTTCSKDDYANQVIKVYGVIHYPGGASYKSSNKLTYTDDAELEKLFNPIKNGEEATLDDIRVY